MLAEVGLPAPDWFEDPDDDEILIAFTPGLEPDPDDPAAREAYNVALQRAIDLTGERLGWPGYPLA